MTNDQEHRAVLGLRAELKRQRERNRLLSAEKAELACENAALRWLAGQISPEFISALSREIKTQAEPGEVSKLIELLSKKSVIDTKR